jgi:hypothetical protein
MQNLFLANSAFIGGSMQGRTPTPLDRRVIIAKVKDRLERSKEFQSKSSRIEHLDTHSQTLVHETESGFVLFPLIPLLQEQQKILRGRFGCHHLYPMR